MQTVFAAGKTLSICAQTFSYLRRSKSPEANLSLMKQQWATEMLGKMGLQTEIRGTPSLDPSILFVGNHISYLDIPLMMASVYGISFVAKKEIGRWPLFGDGARALDTIFVQRECREKRGQARQAISDGLKNGKRIALFPSGTTSLDQTVPWRRGAFEVAHQESVQIQPFRIRYSPARIAAFIDDDALLPHMVQLIATKNVVATIEFHEPVMVLDPVSCSQRWQSWAQSDDLSHMANN